MYKSYLNYERTRKLVRILLLPYRLSNNILEDVITEVIDKAEIDNLDKVTLDNIIEGNCIKLTTKRV